MSQITLIFIRHGEAASSWVSHEDPGLSIKGQDEAKALLATKIFKILKIMNLSQAQEKEL